MWTESQRAPEKGGAFFRLGARASSSRVGDIQLLLLLRFLGGAISKRIQPAEMLLDSSNDNEVYGSTDFDVRVLRWLREISAHVDGLCSEN